jgi:asparagine synthase (glutamine-hydrolysing)
VIERIEDPRLIHTHYLLPAFLDAAEKDNIRVILCGAWGEVGPSSYGEGYLPELAISGHWGRLVSSLRELAKVGNRSFFKVAFSDVIVPLLPAGAGEAYSRLRGSKPLTFAEGLIAQPDFFNQTMAAAGIAPSQFVADNLRVLPNHKKTAFALFRNVRIPPAWNVMAPEYAICFPFGNKRLLEFCLALPGDMKIRHGWKRYMIRAGMEGVLPPEIQWRKTKGPSSPDFFKRIAASRHDALNALEKMESDLGLYNYVRTFVDFKKIKNCAQNVASCDSWMDWKGFDPSWQILLRGLNVLFFLKWARGKIAKDREIT